MTFKIKDGLSVGGASFLDANRNIDVNDITLSGQIKGPATLVIDPAAVGDDTGLVQIRGNLQVDGTTTTINSTTLTIDDKNIVLADGQSTIANIDTAGIDFGSTAVKLKYYYNSNTNPGLSIEGTNVGIGTTAPGARLDILGAASAISNPQNGVLNIVDSTAAAAGVGGQVVFRGQYQSNNYTQYAAITAYKESAIVDGTQYGASLIFNTRTQGGNNTEKMRIDSDGRVGIGTTGPLSRFVVNGGTVDTSTYTSAEARIADGTLHLMKTNAGGVFESIRAINNNTTAGTTVRVLAAATSDPFNNGNGGKVFIDAIRTATNMDLAFSLNDTAGAAAVERVRFMGSGNVGIGTTAPSTRLHVSNVSVQPASAAISSDAKIVVSGTDGNVDLLSQDDNSTVSNSLGFGRYHATTGALIHKFGIVSWANTGSQGSNTGDRIGFHYGTSADPWGTTELVTIKSGGNVGIGTTAPAARLNIAGTGTANDPGLALDISSSASFVHAQESFGANITTGQAIISVIGREGSTKNSAYVGYLYSGSPGSNNNRLTFGHWGADHLMVLDGSGNVGIGTTAPDTKLHVVAGNAMVGKFWSGASNQYTYLSLGRTTSDLEIGVAGATDQFFLGAAAGDGAIKSPNNKIHLGYGSGAPSITINTSNNVGIGTTAPNAKLDISTATPASDTALRIKSNTAFLSPDGNNTITARMLNTDTLSFSGNSGQLFSISDTMTGSIFAVNDISGMPSIEVYDTGQVRLAELSGNVLIGTATDNNTDKLQVAGSASFSTAITTNIFKQPQGTIAGNSATTTLNLNSYGNFYVNLTTNTALAFSNISSNIGSSGYIFLKQDGVGGRTITLPTEAKTPGGRAIVQVTTANSLSMITFYVVDASNVIVNYISDFKTPV